MAIYFEWDEDKASANLRKHHISFRAARAVFDDPFRITEEDSIADGELRLKTIGLANNLLILLVVHLEEVHNGDTHVRIISARRATPRERIDYEQDRSNFR